MIDDAIFGVPVSPRSNTLFRAPKSIGHLLGHTSSNASRFGFVVQYNRRRENLQKDRIEKRNGIYCQKLEK